MKLNISSQVLKGEVETVGGVVPATPAIPILEHLLLRGEGEKLRIVGSDNRTEIQSVVSTKLEEEGSMVIPAKIFIETIRKLPEQPITLYAKKASYDIHIDCQTGNYKISSVNPEDFPLAARPAEGSLSLDIAAEVLLEGIERTLYATSNDELRPAMGGLLVRVQPGGVIFVATDGHRLVECTIPHEKGGKAEDIIVPRVAMDQLKKLLGKEGKGTVGVSFDKDHVVFSLDSKEIVSKLIDDSFPKYENVIPTDEENKNVLEVDRAALLGALERSLVYANKATAQIKLSLQADGKLTLTAEDLDHSNRLEETINCLYKGDPMDIGFNVKFLTDTLKHIKSERVVARLKDPSTGALIRNTEEKEGEPRDVHLIMPIILD